MVESNITYTPIHSKCFIVLLLSLSSPLFVDYLHKTKREVFWNPRGINISLMQARGFKAWIVVVNVFSLKSNITNLKWSYTYLRLMVKPIETWVTTRYNMEMIVSFPFWSTKISTLRFSVEYLTGHLMCNVLACISVTLSMHFNNQDLYMVLLHDEKLRWC